jgi:hypothetical protein
MVHPLAGNPSAFSQWQYISGLKSWQDKEKLPPSEGATPSLEPEQTILQSESQPNELIVNDESQPDKLDSGDWLYSKNCRYQWPTWSVQWSTTAQC